MKTIDTLKSRERASVWYYAHRDIPEFALKRKEQLIQWRKDCPEKYLLQRARDRANFLNLPFNLSVEDIIIPEECPVLKVPFKYGTPYAASIDRIIPALGYVKGNIQVISRKANLMKQDANPEELRKFASWINKSQV